MLLWTNPRLPLFALCSTWCWNVRNRALTMRLLDKWWSNLRLRSKGLIMVAVPAAVTMLIACAAYILATRTVVHEEWVRRGLLISQEIQRLKAEETELSC